MDAQEIIKREEEMAWGSVKELTKELLNNWDTDRIENGVKARFDTAERLIVRLQEAFALNNIADRF